MKSENILFSIRNGNMNKTLKFLFKEYVCKMKNNMKKNHSIFLKFSHIPPTGETNGLDGINFIGIGLFSHG